MSYMITTFFFLSNLLLGVVYTSYEDRYTEYIQERRVLKEAVLNATFQKLKIVNPEDADEYGLSFEIFEAVIQATRPTSSLDDDEKIRVWFDMIDLNGSKYIELEEFQVIAF